MITKCIFCGADTRNSKSVEHVFPESLYNDKIILDRGVVCDKCNNYFALKIEREITDLPLFKEACCLKAVPNKKGRIKPIEVVVCGDISKIYWVQPHNRQLVLELEPETARKFLNNPPKYLTLPSSWMSELRDSYLVSRFLCKVAIEYLIYRSMEGIDEEAEFKCEDEVRAILNFVRYGHADGSYYSYSVSGEPSMSFFSDYVVRFKFDVKGGKTTFRLFFNGVEFELILWPATIVKPKQPL